MQGRTATDFATALTHEDSLTLIPRLLEMIQEIHHVLTARTKSHYTVEELAEQVGRSDYTVRRWIKDGTVRAIRVTGTGPKGRLLIPREEIQRLLVQAKASQIPDSLMDDSGESRSPLAPHI